MRRRFLDPTRRSLLSDVTASRPIGVGRSRRSCLVLVARRSGDRRLVVVLVACPSGDRRLVVVIVRARNTDRRALVHAVSIKIAVTRRCVIVGVVERFDPVHVISREPVPRCVIVRDVHRCVVILGVSIVLVRGHRAVDVEDAARELTDRPHVLDRFGALDRLGHGGELGERGHRLR